MGKHTYGGSFASATKRAADDTKKHLGLEGLTPEECIAAVEKKYDLPLLISLCEIQSKSRNCEPMIEFIETYLSKNYKCNKDSASTNQSITLESDQLGNIYVTKGTGKTYPTFVAHMDTVHTDVDDRTVYLIRKSGNLVAIGEKGLVGVGGDRLVVSL